MPFIIRENEVADKMEDENKVHGDGIFMLVGGYIHGLMGGEGIRKGEVQDEVLC
jgi:hypothetical protein